MRKKERERVRNWVKEKNERDMKTVKDSEREGEREMNRGKKREREISRESEK